MLGTIFALIIALFLWQTLRGLYPNPSDPTLHRDKRTMTDESDWRWFERQDVTQH